MKRIVALIIVLALLFVGLPATVVFKKPKQEAPPSKVKQTETVSLYIEKEDKILNLKVQDYLTGVLFAEMDPEYEKEALKAQAVAAYTFYLYTMEQQLKSPDPDLKGAYISDNPGSYQAYLKSTESKEKFGENYSAYLEKITAAISEVKGVSITYKGEPILSVFHSYNAGATEDAKTVWGESYPYLKSVPSQGDKLSPVVSELVTFTADEIKEKMTKENTLSLDGDKAEWLGNVQQNEIGTVTSITFGGKEFTGAEMRKTLGLKSANFTVELKDDNFTFTVNGYGHGVGMSQYGADYMARQGSDYKEILSHYFTGVTIGG